MSRAESAIELVGEALSCEEQGHCDDHPCKHSSNEICHQFQSPTEVSIELVRKFLSCEEGGSSSGDDSLADRFVSVPVRLPVQNGLENLSSDLTCQTEKLKIESDMASVQNPTDASSQLEEAIRALYPLVTGVVDTFDNNELDSFETLIRFIFPLIDQKEPTSAQVAQILSHAKKLSISLDATDRFLEASALLLKRGTFASAQQREVLNGDFKLLAFLVDLIELIDSFTENAAMSDSAKSYCASAHHQITLWEEAVEVEVNDGYATREEAIRANEEPWWKAAARLNGASTEEVAYLIQSNSRVSDSFGLDSPCTTSASYERPNTFENDVVGQFSRDREMGQRRKKEISRESKSNHSLPRLLSPPASKFDSASSQMSMPQSHLSSLTFSYEEKVKEAWVRQRKKNKKLRQRLAQKQDPPSFPAPINAVSSVSTMLPQRRTFDGHKGANKNFRSSESWRESYAARTKNHDGFIGVDINSLYESCSFGTRSHALDDLPWEARDVKQRFLHEPSVSLNRNWFGSLSDVIGNRIVRMPVCRPASMEMPMKAASWTEEWYRPKNPYRDLLKRDDDESDDEDVSWEETPECGRIKNVKLKIGERISRVTPDLTSSLRQSRWRKRHFRNHPY